MDAAELLKGLKDLTHEPPTMSVPPPVKKGEAPAVSLHGKEKRSLISQMVSGAETLFGPLFDDDKEHGGTGGAFRRPPPPSSLVNARCVSLHPPHPHLVRVVGAGEGTALPAGRAPHHDRVVVISRLSVCTSVGAAAERR